MRVAVIGLCRGNSSEWLPTYSAVIGELRIAQVELQVDTTDHSTLKLNVEKVGNSMLWPVAKSSPTLPRFRSECCKIATFDALFPLRKDLTLNDRKKDPPLSCYCSSSTICFGFLGTEMNSFRVREHFAVFFLTLKGYLTHRCAGNI